MHAEVLALFRLGRAASGRVCVAAAAAAAKAMFGPRTDSWKSDLYSSFCLSKKLFKDMTRLILNSTNEL